MKIVAEKLGLVDLPGTEALMPAELSGGMKKRVALARALALEPKIILYDEPTTGLDPANVRRISALIARTRQAFGVTSIMVTHDLQVGRGDHRPPGHARPGPHHRRRDLERDGGVRAPARVPVPRGRSRELNDTRFHHDDTTRTTEREHNVHKHRRIVVAEVPS